ncbi:MAG: hypothetical protein ABEJ89_01435, partial [Haloarculaceae archaeon]
VVGAVRSVTTVVGELRNAVRGLRNPEYTGENRCSPCTVVNLLIGGVLAVAVAAILRATTGISAGLLGGGLVLFVSLGAIYFRGYLVPGTPTLTKRYFPAWLLAAFGKDPATPAASGVASSAAANESTEAPADPELDLESVLLAAGAIEECAGGRDLCLAEDFGGDWHEEMRAVEAADAGRERLLELLEAGDRDVAFEEFDEAFRARIDGRIVGTWQSHAAFLADVGAARLLRERDPDWERRSIRQRGQLLDGLRLFLETCPACGGPVNLGRDTVESCCTTREVAAVTCEDCGARLFESGTV